MRPVQLILIVLMIGVLFLYFNRLRSGILDRLAVLAFVTIGIVMAAFPSLTTRIAQTVGVGRGVDLFLYLSLVGFAFFGLVLYSKLRDVESRMTDLARSVAVQTAKQPASQESKSDEP